jgi:uncharacterized protein involved in type VI secretion and phage assembly
MLLAEGLAEKAAMVKRLAQLKPRITDAARYQEGEEPEEAAEDLLGQAEALVHQIGNLERRVHATNAASELEPGYTITAALSDRRTLDLQVQLITAAADAAGGGRSYFARQLRTELVSRSALPVAALRTRADALAVERRELDLLIQKAGWVTELARD